MASDTPPVEDEPIALSLNDHAGRPLKFHDIDEVKAKIEAYFADCEPHWDEVTELVEQKSDDGKLVLDSDNRVQYETVIRRRLTDRKPLTVTGLARALGSGRKLLIEYEERALADSATDFEREFRNTIKAAKDFIQERVEGLLSGGGAPPAGVIFNLKNNWGWVDKTEVDGKNTNDNRNTNLNVDATELTDEQLDAKLAQFEAAGKAPASGTAPGA